MPTTSRPCIYEGCTRKGAFSFNHLCSLHWNVKIEANIKKFVEEEKRKIADEIFPD